MASVGSMIDELKKLRDKKAAAQEVADAIDKQVKAKEAELIELMQAEGLEKAAGKTASVSLSKTIVASVSDWDQFYEYIRKNKFFHLLQRRVSDPAYRELVDAGKKVPGVEPFTKTGLRVTTTK